MQPRRIEDPINVEVERALLGALLVSPGLLHTTDGLADDLFGLPAHRLVYRSIAALGAGADLVSVTAHLDETGALAAAGGPEAVSGLVDGMPRLASVRHYVEVLRDTAYRRRAARAGHALSLAAANPDPDAASDAVRRIATGLLAEGLRTRLATGAELAEAELAGYTERTRVPTACAVFGLPALDALASLHRGSAWFVGARPSVGKTSFLVGMTCANLRAGKRVLYLGCEMGEQRLAWRFFAHESGVALTAIIRAQANTLEQSEAYSRALMWMQQQEQFRLAYHPRPTPAEVGAIIRAAKERMGGLDLVLLDYAQKVRPARGRSSMYEERTDVVQCLVAMAGEMDIPLVIGAQLNRDAATDEEKDRPRLGHLKGTGSIEEEATGVVLLHRWHLHERGRVKPAEIILAKQQDGPTAILPATLDRWTGRWEADEAEGGAR
jgi:replicative DNA helicase